MSEVVGVTEGSEPRRYPLTGDRIRNAVLRAAYVTAGRGTPLSTARPRARRGRRIRSTRQGLDL